MREVEFRAKDYQGNWHYGCGYINGTLIKSLYKDNDNDNDEDVTINYAYVAKVDARTVGQYTGLKDKKGNKIYEGDIIEYKRYYVYIRWWSTIEEIEEIKKTTEKQRKDYHKEKAVVKFINGEFTAGYDADASTLAMGIYFESGSGSTNDFEKKVWDFELVGNIYDNPELLKEE